jgi:hypothetical protein
MQERTTRSVALATGALSLVLGIAETAEAQSTIRERGARPSYGVELEPHLLATPFDPPGIGDGDGIGLGVRGTFEILGEGFIPKLNDSVGIGVGLDWIHYDTNEGGRCDAFAQAPNGIAVCTDIDTDSDYLWIPVVMQWNFWLHRRWSVFGEPGLALRLEDMDDLGISPFVLFVGGRFHATDKIAITMRLGYPAFSIGASFLF